MVNSQFLFIWKNTLFLLHLASLDKLFLIGKLEGFFFWFVSFKTLDISSHSLLACSIFTEKSDINLVFPLYGKPKS